MKRITAAVLAVGVASAITASAQQSTSTTQTTQTTQSSEAKTISYTGCIGAGTETKTYVLNQVVPVTKTTETVGTSGTITKTETSYMHVPGEQVEIQQHVGKKVEVTGMVIQPTQTTTTTTSKSVDGAVSNESTVSETKKMPTTQFRVTSIKDLGESCSQ
jgi:hypothetical protein